MIRTVSIRVRGLVATALVIFLTSGCATTEKEIQYPFFKVKDMKDQANDCASLDHYLQQVDAIRWSMRENGIELETEFEQMVQLSLATAGAIAIAPVSLYTPELIVMPYGFAYTNADKLKRADALIIALLRKRQELGCEPHSRCLITGDHSGTLFKLRDTRERVESQKISDQTGLSEVTELLDNLCPVGAKLNKESNM